MPPKHIFCAQCGLELHFIRKVLQDQIIDCIEPHECAKEITLPEGISEIVLQPKPQPLDIKKEFDKFKFVKKLNDLTPKKPDSEPFKETGDKRSTEHLRKEILTSTAPTGLLDQVKSSTPSSPENTPLEIDDEEA